MFQVVKTATKLVDLAFFGHSTYVLTWFVIAPIQFLFGILYCVYVGVYESKVWEWVTKPIPMVLVIVTAIACIGIYGLNRMRALILAALVLSLVADIILIPDGDMYFLLGLSVFLLAHVFYIIAFSISPNADSPSVPLNAKRGVPFVVLFVGIPSMIAGVMLNKQVETFMVAAILIYSGILGSMGWRTAARIGYPNETKYSQIMALVGVFFFMFSDLLIAVNKFIFRVPLAQVWILPTYWVAQSLISISMQRNPWNFSTKPVKNYVLHGDAAIKSE